MPPQTTDKTEPAITALTSREESGAAVHAAKNATKKAATKKAAKEKEEHQPSRLAATLGRLAPEKSLDGPPILIWVVFFRSVVLVADYLLALTTAAVIIPMLGAWLHRQSGVAGGDLTMAGTIALWIAPLLFLVLVLAAGEIAAMGSMWRWSSRRIQAIRAIRADRVIRASRAEAASGSAVTRTERQNRTHRTSKTNQNRSK